MRARQYHLGMADGVYGPGDVPILLVTDAGLIKGPGLPNWQPESLIVACDASTQWHGESVGFLLVGPRYVGGTAWSIRKYGGVVGVSRVLPGRDPRQWAKVDPSGVDYWGVGTLSLVEEAKEET